MRLAKGKSVICVIGTIQVPRSLPDVVVYAESRALPLAVVYCLEPNTKPVLALQKLEDDLAAHNVPLMVLLGEAEERLPWLFGHVEPAKVFFDSKPSKLIATVLGGRWEVSRANSKEEIPKHTISWPGKIMNIDELKQLIDAGVEGC